jgi:hypothetical protein
LATAHEENDVNEEETSVEPPPTQFPEEAIPVDDSHIVSQSDEVLTEDKVDEPLNGEGKSQGFGC